MSTDELRRIQAVDPIVCAAGPGGAAERPVPRRYEDPEPQDVIRIFVDPSRPDDTGNGWTPATAFRTLTRALREVPYVERGMTTPLANAYEINLIPGHPYTSGVERAAPPVSGPHPLAMVEWEQSDTTLAVEQRAGTSAHPLVIQGYPAARGPGDRRPLLQFRLELRSVQHVYLKDLRFEPPDTSPGLDVVHYSTSDTRDSLPAHHFLIRGCLLEGGWRDAPVPGGPASPISSREVLRVNRCQYVFVERCQIYGAGAFGGNCIDAFDVQFAHVVDCDLGHAAQDWVLYPKGGCAYVRVEGNRIHDAPSGFTAGEGSSCEFLRKPWWHYEAYAIQFTNNLVYNIKPTSARPGRGSSVGIQGGYDILIAHNTIIDNGTAAQVFGLAFGERNCEAATGDCLGDEMAGTGDKIDAWVTSHRDSVPMVPSRGLYIYNNVVLVERATSGFSIFDIAADRTPVMLRDVNGTLVSSAELCRSLPPLLTTDATTASRPDGTKDYEAGTLVVRGNFVGVPGLTRTDEMTGVATPVGLLDPRGNDQGVEFVNTNDEGRNAPVFRGWFASHNRADGAVPEIHTDPARPEMLGRPVTATSNVRDAASARTAPPPDAVEGASWLHPTAPPLVPDTRVTPWREMHNVRLDYDNVCRELGTVLPGARSQPGPSSPPTPIMLSVIAVRAPDVWRAYTGVDYVVVREDYVAEFAINDDVGRARVQSRSLTPSPPGMSSGVLHGYMYRVELAGVTAGPRSISSLTIPFGPVTPLDYGATGVAAHVYYVSQGGMGSAGPREVRVLGHELTMLLDPPLPPGSGSYFIGLTSRHWPRAGVMRVRDSEGDEYLIETRVPAFPF